MEKIIVVCSSVFSFNTCPYQWFIHYKRCWFIWIRRFLGSLLAFMSGMCSLQDECGLLLIFLCFPKHRYIDIVQYMSGCHVLAIWLNFLLLYIVNSMQNFLNNLVSVNLHLNAAGCSMNISFLCAYWRYHSCMISRISISYSVAYQHYFFIRKN